MRHIAITSLIPVALLAGCAEFAALDAPRGAQTAPPATAPATSPRPPSPNARTVEEFDTTTADERQAAVAVPAVAAGSLGRTVASLGDPGRSGFWLETPLVSTPTKGSVLYPRSGRRLNVDLLPIAGPASGGSRLSLAAMRLLEAPLTGLPEIEVFRRD